MCSEKCSELANIICAKLNVEYEESLWKRDTNKDITHANSGDCSQLRSRTTTTQNKDTVTVNVEILGVTRCILPSADIIPYVQSFTVTNTFKEGYFIHLSLNIEYPTSHVENSDVIGTLVRLISEQGQFTEARTLDSAALRTNTVIDEPQIPAHPLCKDAIMHKLDEHECAVYVEQAKETINDLLFCKRDSRTMPASLQHYHSCDERSGDSGWIISTGVDVLTSGIVTRLNRVDLHQHTHEIQVALYVHRYLNETPVCLMAVLFPHEISKHLNTNAALKTKAIKECDEANSKQLAVIVRHNGLFQSKLFSLLSCAYNFAKTSKLGFVMNGVQETAAHVHRKSKARKSQNFSRNSPY